MPPKSARADAKGHKNRQNKKTRISPKTGKNQLLGKSQKQLLFLVFLIPGTPGVI